MNSSSVLKFRRLAERLVGFGWARSFDEIDELDNFCCPRLATCTHGHRDLVADLIPRRDNYGGRSEEFVVLVLGLATLIYDGTFEVNQHPSDRIGLRFQSFYLRELRLIGVAAKLHLETRGCNVDTAVLQRVVDAQLLTMSLQGQADRFTSQESFFQIWHRLTVLVLAKVTLAHAQIDARVIGLACQERLSAFDHFVQ